jgi:hypothetical protein
MQRLIIILFFIMLASGAVGQRDTSSSISVRVTAVRDTSAAIAFHYQAPGYDGAIFPAGYGNIFSPKRFTPSVAEIELTELMLSRDLKKLNKDRLHQSSTPIIHKNLESYQRQYFGYIDENGDRIILINCFWAGDYDNTWLNKMIRYYDGGSFYWQVRYNIDKGLLFGLKVNIV